DAESQQDENAKPNTHWQSAVSDWHIWRVQRCRATRLKPERHWSRTAASRHCRGIESAAPPGWQTGTRERDCGGDYASLGYVEWKGGVSSLGHGGRRLRRRQ